MALDNYEYMEAIFSNKQAIGKFAMGSNEPLGVPVDVESSCKDESGEGFGGIDSVAFGFDFSVEGIAAKNPSPSSSSAKRKRSSFMSEVDVAQIGNMSDAVREMAGAIKYTVHGERPPGLYKAVMDLDIFPLNHRLVILEHLTENKGHGLNFVEMEEDVRIAEMKRIMSKHPNLI